LEEDQALRFIKRVLKGRSEGMTTQEIQDKVQALLRCSDDVSHFLHRFRSQGLIQGEFSKERRAWVWRYEGED
jgi:hypothetical protein